MRRRACRILLLLSYLTFTGVPTNASAALTAEAIYAAASPALCEIQTKDASGRSVTVGSGIRIAAEGLVATNFHVIRAAASATVKCGIGQGIATRITKASEADDVAVIATTAVGPAALLATTDLVVPGSQVYAMGSSLGLEGTITVGLTSGIRDVGGRQLLQISAPISPGNSGGPILNEDGHVIGIAVGAMRGGQNVNFAIPIATVLAAPHVALTFAGLSKMPKRSFDGAPPVAEDGAVADLVFRGVALGASCTTIAARELERTREVAYPGTNGSAFVSAAGDTKKGFRLDDEIGITFAYRQLFPSRNPESSVADYPGVEGAAATVHVVATDSLYGGKVLVSYECDDRRQLVAGRYSWMQVKSVFQDRAEQVTQRLVDDLTDKFGPAERSVEEPASVCVGVRTANVLGCDQHSYRWTRADGSSVLLRVALERSGRIINRGAPELQGLELLYLHMPRLKAMKAAADRRSADGL